MKRILTAWTLVLALSLALLSPAMAFAPADISNGSPSGLIATGDGGYLMTDVFNNVIWKVAADGTVTRYAGQISVSDVGGEPIGSVADGTSNTALFLEPWGIAPFLDGYLVSEPDANVIRYVTATSVQTAAGTGEEGNHDGAAPTATFSAPTGLAADDQGNVYVADTGNGAIRKLSEDGEVTTVFTGLNDPTGLFWKDGVLYICETGAHCISKIEDGKRTVLIGAEDTEGYTDGYVKAARIRNPQGVVVAADGTIYFSDTGNSAVRCLRGDQVSTLARSEDDTSLAFPRGLLLTEDGLLVADVFTRCVIKLSTELEKFSDVVPGAWYEAAVYDSVQRGLFNGVGNGCFDPGGTTNRAMLAQMLVNLQQQLDADVVIAGDAHLSDVPESSWYYNAASWAVDMGFMDTENGAFNPMREITRQEMTLALWRFAVVLDVNHTARADLSAYHDADRVADWAQESMSWAIAVGLIRGVGGDMISPDTTTTRAQMVQVMIRFMDLLQKN